MKPLATTRTVVDTYEEEELETFFEACTIPERAIFKAFYYTGLREQELEYLDWSDLNFKKKILTVRAKPEEGFIPKDWEERTIPLHPELVELLMQLPRRNHLVFPSFRGNPNGHLLRMLNLIVKRAELPGRWYLHKFRKTFATRALEKGGRYPDRSGSSWTQEHHHHCALSEYIYRQDETGGIRSHTFLQNLTHTTGCAAYCCARATA